LLGIGVVCHIQLLTISALTGKFNRFFVSRCERSSSSTERACSWYAPLSLNMSCPQLRSAANPPANGHRCCYRSMGQRDGRTDGRTLDRFINPAPHIMRGFAGSFKNHDVTYRAAPAATSGVERRRKQFTCCKPFQTILNFSHSCAVVYKISTDTAHCAVCLRQ